MSGGIALAPQPGTKQPFLRIPYVVPLLATVLIAIEAAREYLFADRSPELFSRFGVVPARYSDSFLAAHHFSGGNFFDRAIPFVSYLFLHADWTHVLLNSALLLPFGAVVARRYGNLLFILFFLVCGIAGAITHVAFNWESMAPVIGASAAVSGLMAGAFRIAGARADGPLTPMLSSRIIVWSALWTVANVVAGMMGLGAGSGIRLVAWQAHLGGYYAGLLLSGPFDWIRHRWMGERAAPRLNPAARTIDNG